MQTPKQNAIEAIQQLPDAVDMEEIMYRLYVIDKVHKGQNDVREGRTITAGDLRREMDQW
ncbi:MAG: hypothetical protein H0W44_09380 [Gammaproteobacteria bacterium]|nr:hypothetical protein [Gammaproteobacteria bacterium]